MKASEILAQEHLRARGWEPSWYRSGVGGPDAENFFAKRDMNSKAKRCAVVVFLPYLLHSLYDIALYFFVGHFLLNLRSQMHLLQKAILEFRKCASQTAPCEAKRKRWLAALLPIYLFYHNSNCPFQLTEFANSMKDVGMHNPRCPFIVKSWCGIGFLNQLCSV